ncbi:unnamed protein product [Brassica napus]|uniref:(rape) hypothetical protein n=1 Tax=Brassica napus TaxID=3708 RepID=A0A816KH24_BRANA|nr:unnamed protein product [Brassica napus]
MFKSLVVLDISVHMLLEGCLEIHTDNLSRGNLGAVTVLQRLFPQTGDFNSFTLIKEIPWMYI